MVYLYPPPLIVLFVGRGMSATIPSVATLMELVTLLIKIDLGDMEYNAMSCPKEDLIQ
jgi:hypothetical protein